MAGLTEAEILKAKNYARELVLMGTAGRAMYAPLSAEAPAENLGAVPETYVDLGYLSNDGVKEELSDERKDLEFFNSASVKISKISSREETLEFTLWSATGLATAMYYDKAEDAMAFDDASKVTTIASGDGLPSSKIFRLLVDVLDGEKHKRIFLPNAEIVERQALEHKRGEQRAFAFKVRANLDPVLGYSVRREFKEGWKPGAQGTVLEGTGAAVDFGAWNAAVDAVEAEVED